LSLPGWIDGRLVEAGAAALPLGDSAHGSGLGCYTSARWLGTEVWHGKVSARRLARDASSLGIGWVEEASLLRAMYELGEACFGGNPGIVRFEASRSAAGRLCLTGTGRPIGPEPACWRAISAPFAHPGPAPWGGAKVTNHLLFALARTRASEAGADEALLFDGSGRLVEGSRTSPLFVGPDERLCTPPLARGGVAGVGLEILREKFPGLAPADLQRSDVSNLRELLVLNSVRGPVPVAELDGQPIGEGASGPWAARLLEALAPPSQQAEW
jgi:branched-chain amino acid aminotransferase